MAAYAVSDVNAEQTHQPTKLPTPTTDLSTVPATYTKDIYDSTLVRYQNPDLTACVASSTEMMLNFISKNDNSGTGFVWKPTTFYSTQETILAWDRAHDTYAPTDPGTDAHGWRNGLNEYGWGTYSDPNTMVYKDMSFSTYDLAVKAAIMAIARYDKPVGILGWGGDHAQFINGYVVTGSDPADSSDFTVNYIYLTDPLQKDALRNARISNTAFRTGLLKYRFRAYKDTNSPLDDPYISGVIASYKEWLGKWVIVAPVR